MRSGPESHRPLVIAFAVSVVIHGVAGAAFVMRPSGERGVDPVGRVPAAVPSAEPPVELGRDESPHVSINWLGFEDPTEHRAIRSETDQAAMAIPRAEEAVEAETAEELSEPAPEQAAAPPTPELSEPEPAAEQPEAVLADAASGAAESEAVAAQPLPEAPVEGPAATMVLPGTEAEVVALRLPVLGLAGRPESEAEPAQREAQADEATERAETAEAQAARPPAPPVQEANPPVAAAVQSASKAEEGDPDRAPAADRDAMATSRELVVSTTQLGRPIIGQGIEVIPVRPDFATATLILASPRDPVVRIEFGPGGRVRRAVFATDETGKRLDAGSSSVDEPLLDAVYRWRAKGERIDALAQSPDPEARVVIRMRIRLR